MPPKKTKAQVARLARSAAMKKYDKFTLTQLGRELNKLGKDFKIDPAEGTKIKISVVKKLILKKDKELEEKRKALRKKVPEKKKVSKADYEKAERDLKKSTSKK